MENKEVEELRAKEEEKYKKIREALLDKEFFKKVMRDKFDESVFGYCKELGMSDEFCDDLQLKVNASGVIRVCINEAENTSKFVDCVTKLRPDEISTYPGIYKAMIEPLKDVPEKYEDFKRTEELIKVKEITPEKTITHEMKRKYLQELGKVLREE
ncbi:MAG: hypothetical protein ACTSX6_00400 [Candidatus Heimdallarchaeaceae archaeon]